MDTKRAASVFCAAEMKDISALILEHYEMMIDTYIARKHLSWCLKPLPDSFDTYTAVKTMMDGSWGGEGEAGELLFGGRTSP